MDDRFDRRELLLHLGDMLSAVERLSRAKGADPSANTADAPVSRVVPKDDALHALFAALPPHMTVSVFSGAVASAFSSWPEALLAERLDRDALASAVQRSLFDGNPQGWIVYREHVRQEVEWFGEGLADQTEDVTAMAGESQPVATEQLGLSSANASNTAAKRGWPWPERN